MSSHEFTLVLDHTPAEEELDALFGAGLDDATPEYGPHTAPVLHVHRDADTVAAAIVSAVRQAESAGFAVIGVRTEDLVTLRTVAARIGRTYEGVRRLASGQRGPGGFPEPVGADGYGLYSWVQVSRWLAAHQGRKDATTEYERTVAAADHLVRARHLLGGSTGNLAALAS
jgi:hypothetical protein